jgi:hypothetical protein
MALDLGSLGYSASRIAAWKLLAVAAACHAWMCEKRPHDAAVMSLA